MICPVCNCPYRPGYRACADCRVDLVARLSSTHVTVVRDGVRQIVYALGSARWQSALVLAIPTALMLPLLISPDDGPAPAGSRLWACLILGAMMALVALSALPISSGRGSLRYEELKDDLAVLPIETAASVLLPLREDDSGDIRRLARAVMRDLRIPTEIAPADATDGRGRE